MIQIFNQNKPSVFFIYHHIICSHVAIVCNGATVSMETADGSRSVSKFSPTIRS